MDVEYGPFDSVYSEFRKSVKELNLHLAAVMSIALKDCPTVYGKFQLLDSFDGGLLERRARQPKSKSCTCLWSGFEIRARDIYFTL